MIEYSKVLKRENNLSKSRILKESTFNKKRKCFFLYERAITSLNKNLECRNNDVQKFLNTCVNENVADELLPKCISILEEVSNNDNLLNLSANIFNNEIIPKIYNLEECKNKIISSSIPNGIKEKSLESIKENKIADRIIKNNIQISKKYDMGKYLSEHIHISIDRYSKQYCVLVETFKVPTYGKMNIVLEQISYNLDKYGIKYNKDDVAHSVLEYFMLSNESVSVEDLESFKKILDSYSGYTIQEKDEYNDEYVLSIKQTIDLFIVCREEKSLVNLNNIIDNIISTKSVLDVATNLPIILNLFKNIILFYNIDSMAMISEMCRKLTYVDNQIVDRKYSDIKLLADNFYIAYKDIENTFESDRNDFLSQYKYILKSSCSNIIEYLPDCKTDISKVEEEINIMRENSDVLTLNEFKIFKFQNLINAVIQTDKFIARKNLKIKKSLEKNISVIFNNSKKFFTEANEDDILKYVSEDNYFEFCLGLYESNSRDNDIEIHNYFRTICEDINSSFKDTSYRIIYEYNDSIFSLYLKDTTYINLSESEIILKESMIDDLDLSNAVLIMSESDKLEKLINLDIEKLIPDVHSLIESKSEYTLEAIKLLSYSGLDNSYIINRKCKNIFNEDFNLSCSLNYTLNEANIIQDTYIPFDVRLESALLLNQIVNEEVNVNNIKLAIEGLKKKVIDMGSKEKECSRNLDATVNHFVQSIENALTNDRREAIIKGSVIPSFSKCIKYAIVLTGVGLAAKSVIIPVIVAFCGLALSTKISFKERSLLLDEIDIELKALEKEIQMAEDSRNMKKYRTLLTYQKKLQREKQRIRYNLKTGQQLPDKN